MSIYNTNLILEEFFNLTHIHMDDECEFGMVEQISTGGQRFDWTGKKFSEEHRRKISEALKGKKRSAETCRKLSEARKNISDETRRKISESMKGNTNSLEHKHSAETRRKISESMKRRNMEAKKSLTI